MRKVRRIGRGFARIEPAFSERMRAFVDMEKWLFEQACEWLGSLQHFGIKLGLEQTRELADRCGAPDRDLRFIHLAGTNGKGSTGALLERALRENGLKTGFYSSPHLISVCERIRIDGRAVSETEFASAARQVRDAAEVMRAAGRCPTYFEATTVMALLIFKAHRCDWVVWETGMGGRLDSTNIVTPEAAVITGIAFDHERYLGHTLEAIAGEKAGIVKARRPVILGKLPAAADAVIAARAQNLDSPLYRACDMYPLGHGADERLEPDRQVFYCGNERLELSLNGLMQRHNAQLAMATLKVLGMWTPESLRGLALTRWPARIELCRDRRVLVDGGHNPDGLAALVEALGALYPQRRFHWVFGAFADKDFAGGLKLIAPLVERLDAVGFAEGTRQSAAPEKICTEARQLGITNCGSSRTLAEILAEVQSGDAAVGTPPLVVAGSLYLAGEALTLLEAPSRVLDL